MLKFPNNSFRPKQIYHKLAETDEFKEIVVIGLKADNTFGFYHSTSDWVFLAAAGALLGKLVSEGIMIKGAPNEKT